MFVVSTEGEVDDSLGTIMEGGETKRVRFSNGGFLKIQGRFVHCVNVLGRSKRGIQILRNRHRNFLVEIGVRSSSSGVGRGESVVSIQIVVGNRSNRSTFIERVCGLSGFVHQSGSLTDRVIEAL